MYWTINRLATKIHNNCLNNGVINAMKPREIYAADGFHSKNQVVRCIVIFLNKTKQQNLKLELLILILSFIYKQNFKPYFL